MKIWDLRSLLVWPIIFERISFARDDWIFGWRSLLASLILNWCLVLIVHRLWWVNLFRFLRTPWIQFLRFKVLRKTLLDLQKRFPKNHACPICLAAHFCGSAFPENGFAFHQELDEVGKTQVDWQRGNVHCVLLQYLENLSNHSYNWFHSAIPESCLWVQG